MSLIKLNRIKDFIIFVLYIFLCLFSSITIGDELDRSSLLCYEKETPNSTKKKISGYFFHNKFYTSYFIKNFDEAKSIDDFDIETFENSEVNFLKYNYKLTDSFIELFVTIQEKKIDDSWFIDRYTGEIKDQNKTPTGKICDAYNDRNLMLDKMWSIRDSLIKKYKEKLKKRKF